MKNTALLLSFASFMLFAGCTAKPLIEADIKGLGDDTVFVRVIDTDSGETVRHTVAAKDGWFAFDPEISIMSEISIYTKNTSRANNRGERIIPAGAIELILNPGEKVSITGELLPQFFRYRVEGSQFNDDYARYLDEEAVRAGNMAADSPNNLLNTFPESGDPEVLRSLFDSRGKIIDELNVARAAYIDRNPDSEASAFMLLLVPVDMENPSWKAAYDRLGDRVKHSRFSKFLDQRLDYYNEWAAVQANKAFIQPGSKAPEFTLKDASDNDVSLSGIAPGKYLVLDFWGSWCGPCISGIPKMKEYHEKYKGRIEFVGIACNDTEEAWKAALAEHSPGGVQLIDDTHAVATSYAVEAYPTKIILDPERNIVQSFRGEGEDFYRKLDELFR